MDTENSINFQTVVYKDKLDTEVRILLSYVSSVAAYTKQADAYLNYLQTGEPSQLEWTDTEFARFINQGAWVFLKAQASLNAINVIVNVLDVLTALTAPQTNENTVKVNRHEDVG